MGNCQQSQHSQPVQASGGSRFVDGICSFMDADDYPQTNIYKSDVLYHDGNEATSYNLTHLAAYTQSSKTINDALIKDAIFTNKTAVRELDKCLVGVNHSNIYGVFQQVWSAKNQHVMVPVQRNFITVFRGARLTSLDLNFLKSCLKEDKCLRNRCFLSCSMVYDIALQFQDFYVQVGEKVLFAIYLHKDDRRSFAYVKPHSAYPVEEEVIVRPCRRFQISGQEYDAPSATTTISLVSAPE